MALLKQSTAYTRSFLMIDSADHISGKTGLTVTVNLSKAGGSFAAAGGTVSEIGNGWYKIGLTTTDTNTLGDLVIKATATGADPTGINDQVIAADLADATRLGLSALPNAAAGAIGGLPTGDGSGHVALQADQAVNVTKVNGTAQTARDLGGQLDAAVSTRLASASYTAPDNTSITAIKAKTDNLPSDPADESLIISATNAIAALIGTPAGASIAADIAALPDGSDNAGALLDLTDGVEDSLTFRQFCRLVAAVLLGKASGLAGTTATFRDTGDTTDRVVATVDENGNRTGVTLDAS